MCYNYPFHITRRALRQADPSVSACVSYLIPTPGNISREGNLFMKVMTPLIYINLKKQLKRALRITLIRQTKSHDIITVII